MTASTTNTRWSVSGLDEQALGHVAEVLAAFASPGDAFCLSGPLGAGKTTFARAFIRAAMEAPGLEVQSPTFALLQSYRAPRFQISHYDLYRIEHPDEVIEIDFEEAVLREVTLVEWPVNAANHLPGERIDVCLEIESDGTRTLSLDGRGNQRAPVHRLGAILSFLRASGWHEANVQHLQGRCLDARLCPATLWG